MSYALGDGWSLYCAGPNGRQAVSNRDGSVTDYPVVYHNLKVAYDCPETIPASVRKRAERILVERKLHQDNGVYLDDLPVDVVHLWWQCKGLSYTRSGYGSKIPTSKMVLVLGRWRRVYCSIYSNSGTCWFILNGARIIVR